MIAVDPVSLSCTACEKSIVADRVVLEGTLSWLQVQCSCGVAYEMSISISHQTRFPIIRSKTVFKHTQEFSGSKANGKQHYFYDALIGWQVESLLEGAMGKASYSTEYVENCKEVRVFNCLDSCYGHALLRLLQVYPHLQQKKYGVVVMIPEVLRWMLPEGIAAALIVKSSLSQLKYPLENFDAVASDFLNRFEKITFDSLPLDFDYAQVPVELFTRVKPFERKASGPKQLTILWREDRFWLRSKTGERMAQLYYKYKWKWLKSFLVQCQLRNYQTLVFSLKKNNPDLLVNVAGVASSTPVLDWANDKRIERPSAEDEKNWCALFAASDLVIGIHGSHMLLPTAHAGAFIELLPEWKITHQGEDILYNRSDLEGRTKARVVSSRSSVKEVQAHAEAILNWWPKLY